MQMNFRGHIPNLAVAGFVAPNATVIGDVEVGRNVTIWYGTIIRGDINSIFIGAETNVQDLTVIHVDGDYSGLGKGQTWIGERVTIGHRAILHACTVEDECLIGMGATILSGARIGKGSIVAAGALILEGQIVPPGSLVVGLPGAVFGPVSPERLDLIRKSADRYVKMGREHSEALQNQ